MHSRSCRVETTLSVQTVLFRDSSISTVYAIWSSNITSISSGCSCGLHFSGIRLKYKINQLVKICFKNSLKCKNKPCKSTKRLRELQSWNNIVYPDSLVQWFLNSHSLHGFQQQHHRYQWLWLWFAFHWHQTEIQETSNKFKHVSITASSAKTNLIWAEKDIEELKSWWQIIVVNNNEPRIGKCIR